MHVCVRLHDATDTGSRGVMRVRSNVGFCEACIAVEFRPLDTRNREERHSHSTNASTCAHVLCKVDKFELPIDFVVN